MARAIDGKRLSGRTRVASILSLFSLVDERPMDWVKPKHRARRLKSTESVDTGSDAERRSASHWLEQLCEENVALLQSSLPVAVSQSKRKNRDHAVDRYLNSMLWGTGDWEVEKPSHREFLHDLVEAFGGAADGSHAAKIGKWITQQLPKSNYDPYVALTCAGWLHALPHVGRDIPPALWLDVLQSTLTQVDRAWETGHQDGLFPWIIWACEIPLALAKQLSHLGGKDRIVSDTLNRIALVLEQTADDPQTLLSFGAQDLRAVVASLIRSRWSATGVGARKWYPPQRKALSKLAMLMLHLTDGHGRSLLTEAETTRHDPELWTSMLELCSASNKLRLACAASLPNDVGRAMGMKPARIRKDKSNDASLPPLSVYWESNRIATMRRSWRDAGYRIAVDFSSDVIWLDITAANGQRLFSGDWDVELFRNGTSVEVDVAWEEVCWFTDDDVDYLELECDLEDRCKLQRQVMLMREEGMVFMADAVLSNSDARWDVRTHWTLAADIEYLPEAKTNDGVLIAKNAQSEDPSRTAVTKRQALLLPIGMPEWRRGTRDAALQSDGQRLTLRSFGKQKRMYNPLLVAMRGLDRDPPRTWRRLTIAQDLVVTPPEIAQAYRAQVGKDQWVFYRSLGQCKRRTLMGMHLNTEFYAARFSSGDGSYEALVEVNAE